MCGDFEAIELIRKSILDTEPEKSRVYESSPWVKMRGAPPVGLALGRLLAPQRHWKYDGASGFWDESPKNCQYNIFENIRQYKLLKLYKCWHV